MGTRNDDISLILAKAKKQGFLPDVADSEVDVLEVEAKKLFGKDLGMRVVPNVYNVTDSSMRRIRAKVARACAGNLHSIALMGHSYFAGSNATPGVTDFGTALKKSLISAIGDEYVHTGIVMFRNGETRDSRYSGVSAGWGLPNGAELASFATCATAGAELTFTSDTVGTIVKIATFENSAAFTYSIDGGAAVTVNTLSGNIAPRVITVTGLSNTTHTVKIIATTSSNTYFTGAGVCRATGLEIVNGGYGGSYAYDWAPVDTATRKRRVSQGITPSRDISIIQMDTNDLRNGQTPTNWKNNIGAVISGEQGLGAGVILVMSVDAPASDGSLTADKWEGYYNVAYDLADAYDIPLLDTRRMFDGWSNAVANSLTGDLLHPNAGGYKLTANALTKLLIA